MAASSMFASPDRSSSPPKPADPSFADRADALWGRMVPHRLALVSLVTCTALASCSDDGTASAETADATATEGTSSTTTTSGTTTTTGGTSTTGSDTTAPGTSTTDFTGGGGSTSSEVGTTGGASFTNEYSVELDGVSAFVNLGARTDVFGAGPGPLTVAMWVKLAEIPPTDALSGDGLLFVEGTAGFGGGFDLIWSEELTNPSVAFYAPGGTAIRGEPVDPTVWTHVVAVFEPDDTGNEAKLYIDGQLAAMGSADGDFVEPTGDVWVGKWLNDNFSTDGLFDEVGIWSVALAPAEIEAIGGTDPTDLSTNAGAYVSADDLRGYWRMGDDNDGAGTTVTDLAGDNDATLVMSATFSTDAP